MLRRLVLALAILALLASAAWTQTPVSERRVFAVSVLDSSGKPLEGLRAADFRAEYRGQPVKILSVEPNTEPRRIAILLDTSKSMDYGGAWELAWTVAEDLVGSLGRHHETAFFTLKVPDTFSVQHTLEKHLDFANAPPVVLNTLRKVKAETKPYGATALFDGIVGLAQQLSPTAFGDALYVISDIQDNASLSSLREVEEALVRAGLRVFVVRIHVVRIRDDEESLTLHERVRIDRAARRLAESSGGTKVELFPERMSEREMASRVRKLYEPITHVYRLEVELPRPIDKPRKWELKVVDANGKELKDVEVFYPRLLVPLSED